MSTFKRLLAALVIVLVVANGLLLVTLISRQALTPIDADKAMVDQVTAMCKLTGVSDDTCLYFFGSRTDTQLANLKTCSVQYPYDIREWINCGQANGSLPK